MKKIMKLTSVIFIALFLMFSNTNINAIENTDKNDINEEGDSTKQSSDNIINMSQEDFLNSLDEVESSEIDEGYMEERNLDYAIGKTADGHVVYANVSREEILAMNKGSKNAGYSVGTNTWKKGLSSTYILRLEMAGIGPVYCIEPGVSWPTGQNYDAGSIYSDNGVMAILAYGFPTNIGGDRPAGWDDNDSYNATYLALNAYLYPNGFSMNPGSYVMTRAWIMSQGDAYLNTLIQRGINGTAPNTNVYVNRPPVSEGFYSETERANITNYFYVGGGVQVKISNLPSNVKIQLENKTLHGNGSWINSNQHFRFYTKDLNYKGTISPTFTSNVQKKAAIIFRSGGVQSLVASGWGDPISIQSPSANFVDTTSRIEMSKIDSKTEDIVPASVFELYSCDTNKENCEEYVNDTIQHIKVENEDGEQISDLNITDENKIEVPNILSPEKAYEIENKPNYYVSSEGKIILDNVAPGIYALKEIISPEGYVINEEFIFFEVTKGGAVIEINAPNDKITSTIKVSKVDSSTKKIIPGAEMKIEKYNFKTLEWEHFIEFTTIDSESIIENVEYGYYRLVELKAPNGYVLKNLDLTFKVEEHGTEIILEYPNAQLPKTGVVDISIIFIVISGILVLSRKLIK